MGVPPSPATKALLAQGLNVVGRVCATSKYKFYDWNIKHTSGTTKLPDSEFKKLGRAAQFFREGHYTQEDIKKIQVDARLAKEAEKKAKEATKLAKESKNLWDKFLSKAKGATQAAKAVSAGGTVAKAGDTLIKFAPIITALISIGISVAVNQIQGWRNDINEDGQQLLSQSISKVLGLMNVQKLKIDKINIEIKKADLENQRVRDRIYGLEKQQPTIRDSVADAKKKANDALYEVRANKPKLEAQIADAKKKANDALYETRVGRTKLEDKIAQVQLQINKFTQGVTSNFQSKIEVTIGIIQGRLSTSENKIVNLEKTKPVLQDKVIQTVQDAVKKVSSDLGSAVARLAQLEKVPAQVQALQSQVKTIEVEHPKRWGITVTQAEVRQATITKSTDSATRTYVERKLATVTQSQFSATEWVGRYGAKTANLVDSGVGRLEQTDSTLASAITTVATDTNQRITNLENKKVIVFGSDVNVLTKKIKDLETELEQVKVNEKKVGADLGKLDLKLKEQEKVNQSAIPKLDQILGILPIIPARTADVIRPSIPTIPQIENAAKTGTCQTFQPGGCGAKALDNLGNGVNQNTNNQAGNLLDKLNAGANAAQLALLKIIDNKLGAQLPGGLSATFGRLWQMLQVDRILNILTYIAVVHNAMMLSNNILQTLFTVVDNISQSVGFKWTNEKGEDAGFGSLINEWTGNFIKSIFGEETFKNISKVWNAANRIYQAAANIAGLVQSIQQSILTALEVVGGSVARLANALRAAGQVFDRAYEWMNPNPNFDNALFRTLGKVQGAASNIETVSQTPLTIKSAVEGMKEEKKAMGDALKDGEAGLKGLGIIESENQVKKADKRKEESAGKNLENVDKVEGEKDEPTS